MAFDLNKLKNVRDSSDKDTKKAVAPFIEQFETILEGVEFEDWLQEQLEYTSKNEKEMYFVIGTFWHESKGRCFSIGDVFISQNNAMELPIPTGLDVNKALQLEYLDAFDKCYKTLRYKLDNLGLIIETPVPKWAYETIGHEPDIHKVVVSIKVDDDDDYY